MQGMNLIELEFIRAVKALKSATPAERHAVAKEVGVSSSIIQKITFGEVTNPKKSTLAGIHEYFFGTVGKSTADAAGLEIESNDKPEKPN